MDTAPWGRNDARARAALSVAVGLAVGTTPLYGLHLTIVLAVCIPLAWTPRWRTWRPISLPPVIPFLLLAEIEVGSLVRTGHTVALTALEASLRASGELARELAVGTAIVAPSLGALGGGVTWCIATLSRRARPKNDPLRESVARVAARYARGRRAAYGYVRGKLAHDPVVARVASMGELGVVVNVGCGRGKLAVLLREAGCAREVRGSTGTRRRSTTRAAPPKD